MKIGKVIGTGIVQTSKIIYNFSKGFLEGVLFIPTACINQYKDCNEQDSKPANQIDPFVHTKILGRMLAFAPPHFVLTYPILYSHIYNYDTNIFWKVLGTQIITNTMSGIYELYKYNKKKIVSTKHSTKPKSSPFSGLESEVEDSQPKMKTPTQKIPNPWDIHIDEIENLGYNKLEGYVDGK